MKNVMVDHQVYGQVRAAASLPPHGQSAFLEEIHSGKSSPLKHLTSDYHSPFDPGGTARTRWIWIQEALH